MSESFIPASEFETASNAVSNILGQPVEEIKITDILPPLNDIADSNKVFKGKLSVLFVDMRKSTDLTDELKSKKMVKVYRSFIRIVIQAIRYSGGYTRQFAGDGIMGIFQNSNVDDQNISSSCKAIKAARYIHTLIDFCLNPALKKSMDMYNVVADILSDRFKEKYAQLYGSITHIEHICQPDYEDDFEVEDPEIIAFYETIRIKSNIDNLMKNDVGYEEYCRQENYVSPLEEYFARICASVLPHGEKTYQGIQLIDEALAQKKKTPAEYIAYDFDFFTIYNKNVKVQEKEMLLDEIKELALDLYENLMIKIRNIGNRYEKE